MTKRAIAAIATAVALTGTTLGVAAPVAAAQEPSGANEGPWEMPNVRGELLSRAIDSVLDVTGDVDLDLRILNRVDTQEVINYTNWEVCAQSPRAGSEISQKTMRVIFAVRRPNTRAC